MSTEAQLTSKPLGEHGLLFTETIKGPPTTLKYYATCKGFHTLKLTLNFEKSSNFELALEDGKDGSIQLPKPLEALITIGPDGTSSKLIVKQTDTKKGGSLSVAMSCIIEKPGPQHVLSLAVSEKKKLKKLLSDAADVFPPLVVRSSSIADLENRCRVHSISFIDVSFPPQDSSLYATREDADGSSAESAVSEGKSSPIVWRRPGEFISDDPSKLVLLSSRVKPSDVKQGRLNNTWLTCAFASLAEHPILLENLFVNKEYNPRGIYQLNLCKNGEWTTVTIDDFLPCSPGEGPIYSHTQGNELWVLLLEKALAKLHGSYAMLRSGFTFEAFVDLTGAPYRDVRFFDADIQRQVKDGTLWQYWSQCVKEGYLMALSTPAHTETVSGGVDPVGRRTLPSGLLLAHAYTVLTAVTTREGHKLVKLRNPWPGSGWNGAWSRKSTAWTPEVQAELKVNLSDNDDSFWMSLEDAVKHFVSSNICKCKHGRAKWVEFRVPVHFKFSTKGQGVLFADMLKLQVTHNATNIFFGIHQPDKRVLDSKPYIDIGISVLKATSDPQKFELVASTGNSVERQHQVEVPSLPAGEYYIVPTSCGTKLRQFSSEAATKESSFVAEDYLRRAVVVLHSSKDISVEGTAFNEYAYKDALELPTVTSADSKTSDLFGDGSVMVYSRRSGYCGISYVVKNNTDADPVKLTFDFKESQNTVTHTGESEIVMVAPPKETTVVAHVAPRDEFENWSSSWSVAAEWISDAAWSDWRQQKQALLFTDC